MISITKRVPDLPVGLERRHGRLALATVGEDDGAMFERFTDRARRVVVLAQEESRRLGHKYIGTEHLLLGLVREGKGVAAQALNALGISLEGVRAQVEEIIGEGAADVPAGHIPFTPRAKKVLELSLREALQLGHRHIGTEHLLLGLLREGEGVAAQVLVRQGLALDRVREKVTELLSTMGGEAMTVVEKAPPLYQYELSDGARRIMDLARSSAAVADREEVEAYDILVALLASHGEEVTEMLDRLHSEAGTIRRFMEQLRLHEGPEEAPGEGQG
jgi:ATP-dependent Clp protease ATP-binding subunit ClpA